MSKIHIVSNSHYRKSGTKSYTHLMRKYRIYPTKEGPYSVHTTIRQTGRPFSDKPVGGRVHFEDVMEKRISDGQVTQVVDEDIQQDVPYFVPVQIGTPPQTLNLAIDTASSNLLVRSPDVAQPSGHHVFDPSRSSTFTDANDKTWEISYIDGSSISGSVGIDTVALGDLRIKNQDIGLADMMSSAVTTQFSGDGFLGLSMVNTWSEMKTIAENLREQEVKSPTSKVFTIKISHWGGFAPFYSFGHIDQEIVNHCAGDIHYANVDSSRGYWLLDSTSAVVGGKTIERPLNKAIIDTGAHLTLLDDTLCQLIYDCIPGAYYDSECQGFVFPSDVADQQCPSIQLDVGGKLSDVQTEALAFAEARPGYVYGGFQSRGSLKFDVLGGTFLEGIYAVFDVGNSRFGIVQPTCAMGSRK